MKWLIKVCCVHSSLVLVTVESARMNFFFIGVVVAILSICDAQNPAPTVPDSLRSITIPSMAQMPIAPPGSPSSHFATKNIQSKFS